MFNLTLIIVILYRISRVTWAFLMQRVIIYRDNYILKQLIQESSWLWASWLLKNIYKRWLERKDHVIFITHKLASIIKRIL